MTREDYIDHVGTHAAAVEFEARALSIGEEFLPQVALAVYAGEEPTPEYWAWLIEQAGPSSAWNQ